MQDIPAKALLAPLLEAGGQAASASSLSLCYQASSTTLHGRRSEAAEYRRPLTLITPSPMPSHIKQPTSIPL